MKNIELHATRNEAADRRRLAYIIRKIINKGFSHIITPHPTGWRANDLLHYDVTNIAAYTWINSRKKAVTIFLLSGCNCKGYRICEFEVEIALSG